jgi:hypothetical protein
MNVRSFSLRPFPAAGAPPDGAITGSIARCSHSLDIQWTFKGRPAALVIPAAVETPARRHGLWLETCFECFVGVKHSPCYWEFNLSPAGHWNVYRFSGYRLGMKEETAFTALPFTVRSQPDSLSLRMKLYVGRVVEVAQILETNVCAVLKHKSGEVSCWALVHPGPQADFHRRDGFAVEI